MSAVGTTASVALGDVLERLLSRAFGQPVELESLERRGSDFQKHTAIEVVTATLKTGQQVELFVKHLGSRQSPHPDQQRRDREACLYQRLLTTSGLPVATCHGVEWDEATARGLLILEHLEGWPLHYHHLDAWFTAARRLASMHAHFAACAEALVAADFLLRIDDEYLSTWAARAVSAIADAYPAELARRLERLVASWDRVVDRIASQPVTLVHNDLSRKNVIVSTAVVPKRFCFVDWEMAGVGCGLLDLVHLRYQRLDPASDRRMLDEYVSALSGTGLLPANARELRQLFIACELHRTVYRLAQCGRWRKPVAYVADRVAAAERLWSALGRS